MMSAFMAAETTQTNTKPFAVIEAGGKQYRVREGDVITTEKLGDELADGDTVTFDAVLAKDTGTETTIGEPYIDGATVTGEVQEQGRGKKLTVVKFKSKSRYFKRQGHRQSYMKVKITGIK
jgi:large subunit ribosomal protein L21